eukprot:TRINITY_DN453_c0_g1_i3.p1 TRINITY_DN453_c0_g1~~TRINITY_DN453_c0_g1_i3.p1  ORF type:complete len:386 (+),score=99.11 TRINITY_DN453_c0_g1_i3:177-1334(+)
MNAVKKCAKCEKTVYPIEEVKCLEKVWHKACFKCQTCNMALSMKNYKGFEKLPYCNAHIPKAKATIVADTPEMKRLAENSKNQSNVKYHAEFEASKGKFTAIADDPEIQRIKANTQTISNISYHGIVEQKAAQERMRNLNEENDESPPISRGNNLPQNINNNNNNVNAKSITEAHGGSGSSSRSVQQEPKSVPLIQQQSTPISAPIMAIKKEPSISRMHHQNHSGKISANNRQLAQQEAYVDKRLGPTHQYLQHHTQTHQQQHVYHPSQQQPVYESKDRSGPISSHQQQAPSYGIHAAEDHPIHHQHHQRTSSNQRQSSNVKQKSNKCFQALYDYDAQDNDEVSFVDGDLIINCNLVDEGWMIGTVHRTGRSGMIPANYVQRVNL